MIHDIRNHLAVAIANVEAMRDGVVEPSASRLDSVLKALTDANALIDAIPAASSHEST